VKKFIAALDGLCFSETTMRHAIYFSRLCQAHLVGVFLEDITRHGYGYSDIKNFEGTDFDRHIKHLNEKDKKEREASIAKFEEGCRESGINYSIHRDRNVALQELQHESVYADLLIIDAGETMTRFEEGRPTRFIKDLLNDVQCPVLLVPAQYQHIEKIVLLYDGEPSSVFAVKSFSYLFDEAKLFKTEILTVRKPGDGSHTPDNHLIKEFSKRHFPNAVYTVLSGDAEEEILHHVRREKQYPLVVLGAYRRSRFSRLLRPSMADYLLQNVDVPLFIAHNKS
jgi:nucleotide-binding universal stress UspA family protein